MSYTKTTGFKLLKNIYFFVSLRICDDPVFIISRCAAPLPNIYKIAIEIIGAPHLIS